MLYPILISLLIGYAFGCIQSAYLLGRLVGKMDIREHGLRYGVIVGLVDILKGLLAVLVIRWIFPEPPYLAFLAGLMAVVGHLFPFYMNFRGGKGVAALVGMMFGLNWKLGILFVLLVAVPAFITDYIVAGSFTTFIALPVVAYVSGYPIVLLIFSLVLTGLCFYLHRENIQRIRKGEELKIRSVLFKS